jgi:hypothetical protein
MISIPPAWPANARRPAGESNRAGSSPISARTRAARTGPRPGAERRIGASGLARQHQEAVWRVHGDVVLQVAEPGPPRGVNDVVGPAGRRGAVGEAGGPGDGDQQAAGSQHPACGPVLVHQRPCLGGERRVRGGEDEVDRACQPAERGG